MNSFIDLRNLKIESRDDLLKYCNTFRNPSFENFRIIYMKDNKSLGYETIVSRIPNTLNRFIIKSKFPYLKDNNLCEDISKRMYKLGANGYYIQRNESSSKVIARFEDMNIAKEISKKIKGFRGYIIVSNGKYAWIRKNKEDNIKIECIPDIETSYYFCDNPLMQKQINSKNDLARFCYDVIFASHYLCLVLTGKDNTIKLFQELPNMFINMNYRLIYEYIKNRCIETDSIRAFITTTNKQVFERAKELVSFGYLTDCIAYTVTNGKAKIIDGANIDSVDQDIFKDVEGFKRKRKLEKLSEEGTIDEK